MLAMILNETTTSRAARLGSWSGRQLKSIDLFLCQRCSHKIDVGDFEVISNRPSKAVPDVKTLGIAIANDDQHETVFA